MTYSLADDFIKNLATYLEDHFIRQGKDLNRLAIVFGGARPRLFLQKELSARIKKPFLPPKFFTIDEFIESILFRSERSEFFTKISDFEASFSIYHLAKKHAPSVLKGREHFSQFLPWAREILEFIEQLDLEAVEIKTLEDIQFNAAIGYDVPESINALLVHIVALRRAFHKFLKEKKSYTRGFAYLRAAESIDKADFSEFDTILFCNFFYLHKTEEAVVKKLYNDGKAFLFFQGDAKEWPVLERTFKNLNCAIQTAQREEARPELSIHAAHDLHSQVAYVAEILKIIKNPDKTVIVAPDPESVIPLLSRIASSVGDLNVSMGYPVKRSSLYHLFECLFKAQDTKKEDAYYTRDYLRLLSHPLVKNLALSGEAAMTRVLCHKVEEVLIGMEETPLGGSLFVSLDEILNEESLFEAALDTFHRMDVDIHVGSTRQALKSALKTLHKVLFQDWEKVKNFYDLSLCLDALLDLLLRHSLLEKYPLNLKIAGKIYEISDEFKNASFKDETFPKEDIFKIFKNKLDSEMVSFSGSPLKGMQILGLFETRSLSFENVIIMDVNETVLPRLKIYEPLIPRDVMLALGLNRLEKEEEIQRYQFVRLLSSARSVHIFYQESEDKERSRFIEELVWKKQKALCDLEAYSIPHARFKIKVAPKEIQIPKRPGHVAFLKGFRFSASSVNTYLCCPLRFYYQYVLGLQEKEGLAEGPEASELGTFIHSVLEETYAIWVGKRPYIDDKFKDFFAKILTKRFENEFKKKMRSDAFLVKEVIDFRLSRFLECEKTRPVKEVMCLEKVFEDTLTLEGNIFRFKAKVDRIDRLGDDSLLIIDYKTGGSDKMPVSPARIDNIILSRLLLKNTVRSFQLPIYYYLVKQAQKGENINAALYNIRESEEGFSGSKLFKDTEEEEGKDRIMGIFMRALEFLLKEIINPAEPFKADQEDSRYCRNCPFFYLCR
jgi:hypothetical protein